MQGWEFAYLFIAFSLKSNDWLWAIRSDRSRQMSNREQLAQVAQDKWATVSKLLRSLMINEGMSDSLEKFSKKNLKSYFLVCFIYVFLFKKERIAHDLFFGEQCERIAQVAHQK